ncbi:hypothetical protein G7046_g9528 [Stylonectria norvegica]|nr:hypothetical protein G7046_g9528 [Stylonectria norvegica]
MGERARDSDLRKNPVGIRLHVLDLWIDELESAGVLEDPAAEAFVRRLGDMVEELKRCPVKMERSRAEQSYADQRLPWNESKNEDDDGDEEDEGWGGIED